MIPVRIQRSRAKGWLMPPGSIYVGRPTRWGNPFVLHDWRASIRAVHLGCRGDHAGRAEAAVKLYRMWLTATPVTRAERAEPRGFLDTEVMTIKVDRSPPTLDEIVAALRGRDLVCWCKRGQPCHADVLLELANQPAPP